MGASWWVGSCSNYLLVVAISLVGIARGFLVFLSDIANHRNIKKPASHKGEKVVKTVPGYSSFIHFTNIHGKIESKYFIFQQVMQTLQWVQDAEEVEARSGQLSKWEESQAPGKAKQCADSQQATNTFDDFGMDNLPKLIYQNETWHSRLKKTQMTTKCFQNCLCSPDALVHL